jgi:uncharacterized protein (AIM24 family)
VEGQSLLGVVYFRLGHYPRAIQIYEELIRVRPAEIAPRINLALCHLKTGQLPQARALLEELLTNVPEHMRGWGYLGLVYQRLGDHDKAAIAFERAGRPHLAARLRAMPDAVDPASDEPPDPAASRVQEIAQREARAARTMPPPPPGFEPPESIAPPSHRSMPPQLLAPGTRVSVPPPLGKVARDAVLIFPERPRVAIHADGEVLVRIDGAFHVRTDCLRALLPDDPQALTSTTLRRRGRGMVADEPLGGIGAPFATLSGSGRLVLGPPETLTAFVSTLDGERLLVREERLLGFDSSIEHESGRMSLPGGESSNLINLSGLGFVVLATRGPVHGLELNGERPAQVRAERLIGWLGRLVPRHVSPEEAPAGLRSLVALSGTGIALLDAG